MGKSTPDTEEVPLEFEKIDESAKRSVAEYNASARPFIIMQGTGLLLGVVSIILYLLWP